MYREIIAVCSQIHTEHTNTLCGQNVEFVNVKLVVHAVTTGLWRVEIYFSVLLRLSANVFFYFVFSGESEYLVQQLVSVT